jgi:undecaprenyl-diphosphatase
MWVWIGATLVGALVCWWIVASHFAFSRPMDRYVSLTINEFASQNAVINHAIYIAGETKVLLGALMIGLVWCCWFNDKADAVRERLLLGLGAVLITAVLIPILQVSLPLRLRPLHDPESGFQSLPGMDPSLTHHWSSFPNDHTALYFALVVIIWQRSRWLGLLALVSAVFGVLPRIYLGLHYSSDIAAGAALGIALVLLFERFGPHTWAQRGLAWEQRRPGLFYGVAFLMSLEIATRFEDIREIGRDIPTVLQQFGIGLAS